jgi:hypothetical protein
MRATVAIVIAVAGVLLGNTSSAGTAWSGATLRKWADGSGVVTGTMAGFRGTANATDYMGFGMDGINAPYMIARLGAKSGYCEFREVDASFQKLISAAMSHTAYVRVDWDPTGRCVHLEVSHGSMY